MNRITPQQVVDAYKKTGLDPTAWDTLIINAKTGKGKACAFGALAYETGMVYMQTMNNFNSGGSLRQVKSIMRQEYGLSEGYIEGFIAGYDSYEPFHARLDFLVGFHDGVEAQLAVLGIKNEP